tara:strand:+ start:360 stop:560 length:201 start_codon:yes stop_codon:yes gene_type:complete
MINEDLNMSVRRFLKKVGVTSQQAIEKSWGENETPINEKVKVKMVLTCEELNLKHTVEGEIGESRT